MTEDVKSIGKRKKHDIISDLEVNGTFKWLHWLDRNITPVLEKSMPPDPKFTESSQSTLSPIEIAKSIWERNQRIIRERQDLLVINNNHSREIADLEFIIKKSEEMEKVRMKISNLRTRCSDMKGEIESLKNYLTKTTEEVKSLKKSLKITTEEKDYWINRMSCIAGKQLRDNNPEITDLSDPNRPLKLADKFSELYDNQWTNAIEYLQKSKQMSEELAIQHLSTLAKECYTFCSKKACSQLQHLQRIVFMAAGDGVTSRPDDTKEPTISTTKFVAEMKTLKDTRKECAYLAEQYLIKDLLPVLLKPTGGEHQDAIMTEYISECIALCWTMVVQDPPVELYWPQSEKGSTIDRDKFNLYTKSGTRLNHVVWPALQLYNHGPLLKKGVVQAL
ncbi:uncharacterized protein LOC132562373 [Ylistrum balloti]|uniref:uncharacterized protein LOC132562373 n=1 Tax=Ylistrum balloti TaxID=509963 RepID=UPI002905BA38|nr:uncharacterized protein LOC132562373 [Ylistrum balloti]